MTGPNNLQLSAAGEDLIKGHFEGFSALPYKDQAGIWTIGYGHTQGVTADSLPITEAQGEAFFRQDLGPAERAVNQYVTVPLSQNEFDSLVSFTFNEGQRKLLTSTLLIKLNRGDKAGAAKEFDRWVWYEDPETKKMMVSNGLVKRRALEKAFFLALPQTGRAVL